MLLRPNELLESSELKGLLKKQIKELTHICFVSASKCNGEPENRKILHGSEEDSGQRGTMSKILFQLNLKQADNFLNYFRGCFKYESLQYIFFHSLNVNFASKYVSD